MRLEYMKVGFESLNKILSTWPGYTVDRQDVMNLVSIRVKAQIRRIEWSGSSLAATHIRCLSPHDHDFGYDIFIAAAKMRDQRCVVRCDLDTYELVALAASDTDDVSQKRLRVIDAMVSTKAILKYHSGFEGWPIDK